MLALMLSGTEQSTAAETEKSAVLILLLIFTNDNIYEKWKSQKFQNLKFLVLIFSRDEKYPW